MSELQIFNHEKFGQVRVVIKGDEPWFVANDVCRVLELGNPRQALTRLDEDEKGVISTDTLGGKQELNAVNEPGLYGLVLGSRKPEARDFKRWLTHEVIPSIRKTGSYSTEKLSQTELLLRSAQILVEQERKLKTIESSQKKQEQELQDIREVVCLNSATDWKTNVKNLIQRIVQASGESHEGIRRKSYDILEKRAKCDLKARQANKKKRLQMAGVVKSTQDKVSKIDVIGDDPRLVEVYLAIIKELSIKYGVALTESSKEEYA